MDRHVIDYADARNMMVDGQVRPNRVYDARILGAMRQLPRERFIPAGLAARAYADEEVPLPDGRALLEPMVIARLVQLLAIRDGERVLVVGCGPGYGAALLAACGARVTALEEDRALVSLARAVMPEFAPSVDVVAGKLTEGWSAAAPYDAILIEGAVAHVPTAIAQQLAQPGGRLVTVIVSNGRVGCAVLAEPSGAAGESVQLSLQPSFDCSASVIPQLKRDEEFVF
jgi:protein-L-isoaspartate(D-aspartate) O-methyltransferase